MENSREFHNEIEQEHYERLKGSMYNGLVFAENGLIVHGVRDAVAYTTSLMLAQGIIPRFTSGGEIWEMATDDFLKMNRGRIEALITKLKKRRKSWKIKTGHRYSRQTN